MLHNTTRETLLQQNQGYVALVIDAAYFMGWKEYHVFSFAEIVALLSPLGTSRKAISHALRHRLFQRQGRRGAHFTLPAISTARKAAGVVHDDAARDHLPETAYSSLSAYRMALHHALILRRPGRYLRWLLARRLGVCKNTTRNYDRKLGLHTEPGYENVPYGEDFIANLPTTKPPPGKRFFFVPGSAKPRKPLMRQVYDYWKAKGERIILLQQVGNTYEIEAGIIARQWTDQAQSINR